MFFEVFLTSYLHYTGWKRKTTVAFATVVKIFY